MRRLLAVVLPLLILFSLTCCNGQSDPFSDYWTSGTASRKPAPQPSGPVSETEESGESRGDIIEISFPDDPSDPEPSGPDSTEPSEDSSAQESSQKQPEPQESSKTVSRTETSSHTSRTVSGSESKTPSEPVSTTESVPSGTSSQTGSEPVSDTTSEDSSDPVEESNNERPVFTQYVALKNVALVWLPANWSYTQNSEFLLDASNSARSQFITATYATFNGTGLNESIIREAAYEELKEQYPVSKGYTVSKTNVTFNDGKHPAITIVKKSEPVRQQVYLLKGSGLLTITFFANSSSDIPALWPFVELA